MSDPVIEVSLEEIVIAVESSGPQGPAGVSNVPGPQGPIGLTGATGIAGATGPAGPQNLYVQQAEPAFTGPGLWFEIDGAGAPVTLWLNS